MGNGLAKSREVIGLERVDEVVRQFEEQWRQGRPDLDGIWNELGGNGSLTLLAALVKTDLRCRFEQDERPAAAEYLERFPDLCQSGDRVLSLVYEEYCLREERNERPDTAEFCARYGPWKDSLESQLRYHRVLSQVVASAPPPPRFPEPGESFLHFVIGSELGRGGAGRVYLARDDSLGGREVALKVSHDRGREPAIMGRLEHPHIIPVHSVVFQERDGTKLRGLCMPYQPGLPLDKVIDRIKPGSRPVGARTLFDVIRDVGPGPSEPAGEGWAKFPTRGTYSEGVAWIVAVLAEALAHAHAQKIYHRDVKPANVLLCHREGPQLLDFNLSHDPNSAIEAEAAARGGTLPYMAPEQLEAFLDPKRWGDVAEPADLYSLGMLLRELLTGQAPEVPDPLPPLPRAIRTLLDQRIAYVSDLRRLNPSIPHALEAIAGRCLALDRSKRYQQAGELAEDLRRFLARQPLKHARNPSGREQLANWSVRNRVRIGISVLLPALVAAAVLLGSNRGQAGPVETSPTFLRAVRALEYRDAPKALDDLRLLGPEDQALPLPAFYTAAALAQVSRYEAAALAQVGRYLEADDALAQVWSQSDANARLFSWGRAHPSFASRAEFSFRILLSNALRLPKERQADAYNHLERVFRLVLQLDPTSDGAQEALANIDESRGQYASAHERLTKMINKFERQPVTHKGQEQLAGALMSRARVSTKWAGSLLSKNPEGAEPPPEIESHLTRSLADLDRSAASVGSDPELAFKLAYIRCDTLLARGDVARRRGRSEIADDFYLLAEGCLDSITRIPTIKKKPVVEFLKKKVNARLHPTVPQPASLNRSQTASREPTSR